MGWRGKQTKNLLKSAGYRGGDTGTPSHGALHRLWGIPDKSPAQGLALLLIVEPFYGFFVPCPKNKKSAKRRFFISGGDTGTRTLDPMIKSHLLYQLSYVPKTEPESKNTGFFFRGSGQILTHLKTKIKKKY